MNKTNLIVWILVVILVVLVALLALTFVRGEEDTWACENGKWVKHGNPASPAPKTGCGEEQNQTPVPEKNITVNTPIANQTVSLPFEVSGTARVFENTLSVRLKTKSGEILYWSPVMAQSPDAGQFGPYANIINYVTQLPDDPEVILEAYWNSPKDGAELDVVSVPVKLVNASTTVLKVFFSNDRLDPAVSCNKVFSVDRIVAKTETPAQEAINLLLAGSTPDENRLSFTTNINYGVKLQKLTIEKGTAKADFSEELQKEVGGSCRVSAIRAQITETLKQFPTVKKIIISINGKTEEILQP